MRTAPRVFRMPLSGIAFNRGTNLRQIFVARFMDLNDQEGDDAWRGTPTCTIHVPQNGGTVTQTVPAGNIYAEPN
jgi:hypothetical protein